ncbi:MAG: hypothetical protein ACPG6B_04305 [Oceanihabitans sp.]
MKLSKTMITTISKTKYIVLALFVAFSFACSSEDGEDGATGPAGPAGPAGTNGTDGNANVISSDWITATYVLDFPQRRSFTMTTPEITQDVLDNSAILFYGRTSLDEVWAVPVSFPFLNQNYSYYTSTPGSVILLCDSMDGSDITTSPYFIDYRYVIIPPNGSGKMNTDFSKMSYEEVVDYFNLDF